jgi:Mlc titration factor MtfA (ptsG expression regulator)
MTTQLLTLLIAVLLLLTPVWIGLGRFIRRRWRTRHGPLALDAEARALLQARCPLYRRAPEDVRLAAEDRTRELLDVLRFIGCAGLEVTRDMRLIIAFQASLLLARFGSDACRRLGGVLIYPESFLAPRTHIDPAGVIIEGHAPLSGEAQESARLVLSWADVEAGITQDDGYNVVLHEFAHFLDHSLDGTLSEPAPGRSWHDLLQREFNALRSAVAMRQPTLIDPYGAEAPAEFFAVATETFFELPRELEVQHPELYAALARIYALDPARWG